MNKYFPIKTQTACQLKWTWSTIHLYTGETNSCHRVRTSKLETGNFDQFHNTDKKIQDRKLMLDGQWPSGGCEYCQNIEKAGGQSDRQFQLEIPNLVPPELDNDHTAVSVTPRIVEVYLDNVCNMSCIYCEDKFSSKIYQENIKHGAYSHKSLEIKNTSVKREDFDQLSAEFWKWMDQNYLTLKRFHVLGGEPFYQPQFETCLEFLESHSNPDLEFNVVSNLKISKSRLEEFLDKIKHLLKHRKIKRFDLTCSIDCWGPEQEYIRYGLDLEQWSQNFEYLAGQKWITLNINQTITVLGLKTIPNLLQYINSCRKDREIGHYFMTCVNQPHLNPSIMGAGYFDDDFDKILAVMPDQTWQQKHARRLMQGIQSQYNTAQRNNKQIENLFYFLSEMDRRRGLSWQQTFPWLAKELENVV